MERIELFDNYINNQLSDAQRSEFDAKLKSDEEFASDFKTYLFTVDGICREAHQDNLDFGLAMKSLSKEKLKEIIGKQDVALPAAASDDSETEEVKPREVRFKPWMWQVASIAADVALPAAAFDVSETEEVKPRAVRFKPWMWQLASMAAVVIIAFTVVFNIEKNARYSVDNAIYASADINPDLARSGGEPIDISAMTDDELKVKLHELTALYQSASTTDEIADYGYALAMAYLRLHDRDKAKEVLEQLVSRFNGNEDYAESVNKWKSILNLLK